jgi:DNA-binding CsgD family transcriptional regulator
MTEKLLSIKEIADRLGRSESYIFAMKRNGFKMTGNRATLTEARSFLLICPKPRAKN